MSDASRNFEIVPAVLTDDPTEFDRILTSFKAAGASRMHIDVIDGSLVPGRTVLGYRELSGRDIGMALDVHLMVDRPDEHLVGWERVPNISRVIAHVESHADPIRIAADCARKRREWWGAIDPDSPVDWLESSHFSECMRGVMFMTVQPGAQGRPFREDVLGRIQTWTAAHVDIPVMVDGGITPQTAPRCFAAGASVFTVGSYVVQSADPAEALRAVSAAIRGA
jgi:ribulose-phosphate 3-epimerase